MAAGRGILPFLLQEKNTGLWGQPGVSVVKFACSSLVAPGLPVPIPGVDLSTACQAMLWQVSHITQRKMGTDVSSGPAFFSKNRRGLAADVSSGLIFLKKKRKKMRKPLREKFPDAKELVTARGDSDFPTVPHPNFQQTVPSFLLSDLCPLVGMTSLWHYPAGFLYLPPKFVHTHVPHSELFVPSFLFPFHFFSYPLSPIYTILS